MKYFFVVLLSFVIIISCGKNKNFNEQVNSDTGNNIETESLLNETRINDQDMSDSKGKIDNVKNYEGIYKFKSLNVEIEDRAYVKSHLADNDDIYLKIVRELDKTYSFEFSIEKYRGEAQVYNSKTGLPFIDGIPFYKYCAEMGGGGTYMDFYYNDDMILVKYHRLYSYPITDLGWDGDTSKEELKFELVLEKYENIDDFP